MNIAGHTFLVTGGTGFIGSALVKALVAGGGRVRTLDDGSRGAVERLGEVAAKVERVTGDVRDATAVRSAIRGVDSVLHLAYVNGTRFFYEKPELVLEVAVKGMINVLDGCIAENVRDLVLASSSEVYQTPPSIPTDETAPLSVPDVLNPRYSYGGGKIISELLALNYGRSGTCFDRVAVFRPHNVHGPEMGWEHVLPQLAVRIARLAAQQPEGTLRLPIQGTGAETRSFIHVDDAVAGIVRVIEGGAHLGVYHVGTADEIAIADLARRVATIAGRAIEIVPGPLAKGGTPRRCPDVAKLRALGWAPQLDLDAGLQRTVEWYLANASKAPPEDM